MLHFRRLPEFEFISPASMEELEASLHLYGAKARLLAGGTDLIPGMREKGLSPQFIIDLKRVPGMCGITPSESGLRVGALTTLHAFETSAEIRSRFPVLVAAAGSVGSLQVRYRGTIGGNLCNASPAADMVPPLMALGARLTVVGDGEREVPIEEFFTGPGKTILKVREFLSQVRIPWAPSNSGASFFKSGKRKAMECALVNVAAHLTVDGESCREARIAMGAVGPTAFRATDAEEFLEGRRLTGDVMEEAATRAQAQARPITDVRSTADYRKTVTKVLVKRALSEAYSQARRNEGA